MTDDGPLEKIPDADIAAGRHSMAECWGGTLGNRCWKLVVYWQEVRAAYDSDHYSDTAYYCEEHKPK